MLRGLLVTVAVLFAAVTARADHSSRPSADPKSTALLSI
jgi:hypothetical protein